MAKKSSLGRQKIKLAKIEIKSHLQVTFSKRRSGLFKKASELCTLCGVEIAIVVFSPAGKVFSFGHPNVESVIDKFLSKNYQDLNTFHLIEAQSNPSLCELNIHYTYILNELELARNQGQVLDNMRKTSQNKFWWEAPFDKMGLNELEVLRDSMEELKNNVTSHTNRILVENANALSFLGGNMVGGMDTFESKPTNIISTSNQISFSNIGYAH